MSNFKVLILDTQKRTTTMPLEVNLTHIKLIKY